MPGTTARDLLRTAVRGGSASSRRLVAIDEAVRRPVGTSRRVGVVQADGGVGASTLVAAVGTLLAARRTGPVLTVDAARTRVGLAGLCGVDAPVGLVAHADGPAALARAASSSGRAVRDGLPRGAGGVHVLGSGAQDAQPWPAPTGLWRDAVAPVSRFFDVVLTDWGHRAAGEDVVEAAALGHVVCVVARADRHSAGRGARLVEAVRGAVPGLRTVLALVDVPGSATVGVRVPLPAGFVPLDWPDDAAGPGCPVLHVPHDGVAARTLGRPLVGAGLPFRQAVGTLAAHLLAGPAALTPPAAAPGSVMPGTVPA